jgi:hypothetical protein
MKNFSVFKRYETGERASRLYLKNLVAKVTSEQVKTEKFFISEKNIKLHIIYTKSFLCIKGDLLIQV